MRILGVDPLKEAQVTGVDKEIVQGDFFVTSDEDYPIVVGKKLAEKLDLEPGKKTVVSFTDAEGGSHFTSFKVVGVFESVSAGLEQMYVYVRLDTLMNMLGTDGHIHELAIFLSDPDHLDGMMSELNAQHDDLDVKEWRELAPELSLIESSSSMSRTIIMIIIMMALIFGIINTMLMSVLERVRELGMLMAVGMNRIRVFAMVVWETIFLCFAGAPIGMFLGFLTIKLLNKNGVDLSSYAEGMSEYGMESVVRSTLDVQAYILLTIIIAITALLASLYPAYKAVRLKPVEAIRTL